MSEFRSGWYPPFWDSYLLLPFAGLYAAGWELYRSIYTLGLKQPHEPHKPVVTIGSLLVGGAGKTPIAMHVYDCLCELGEEVVISASGYGSPASRSARLAPDGPLDPADWGDEPAMIRDQCPDAPLIVGRDRVEAARICAAEHPRATLLLDDGFQHLRLRQHARIVLDPPRTPNGFTLPSGPYREPRSRGRERADLVLPGKFEIVASPPELCAPEGDPVRPEPGQRVQALCALGQPHAFEQRLQSLGLEVVAGRYLRDHDPLQAPRLLEPFEKQLPITVTAKDWVKLRSRKDLGGWTFWIAPYELAIVPHEGFMAWLKERLVSSRA